LPQRNLAPWVDTGFLGTSAAESEALVTELAPKYLQPNAKFESESPDIPGRFSHALACCEADGLTTLSGQVHR
jgi:hypothetical protein